MQSRHTLEHLGGPRVDGTILVPRSNWKEWRTEPSSLLQPCVHPGTGKHTGWHMSSPRCSRSPHPCLPLIATSPHRSAPVGRMNHHRAGRELHGRIDGGAHDHGCAWPVVPRKGLAHPSPCVGRQQGDAGAVDDQEVERATGEKPRMRRGVPHAPASDHRDGKPQRNLSHSHPTQQ
jgi:hypothetical protein